MFVQKQDNVPHITEALIDYFPDETVVLGEVTYWNDNSKTSKDVTKIMGSLPKKAIQRQEDSGDFLYFYIFDVLMYDGEDVSGLAYEDRISILEKHNEEHLPSQYLPIATFYRPEEYDLEELTVNFLESGSEGVMLMKRDERYHWDKRPAWTSIKIKQETMETVDVVITGFVSPTKEFRGEHISEHIYWENVKTGERVEGRYYGQPGYLAVSKAYFYNWNVGFTYGAYYGKTVLEIGRVVNITDALKEDTAVNPEKYLGKVLELRAMSIDQEGRSLRHAVIERIRDDKPATDCKYEDIFNV